MMRRRILRATMRTRRRRTTPPGSPARRWRWRSARDLDRALTRGFIMLYRGMDRAQLDAAYDNRAAVKNVVEIRAGWDKRAQKIRTDNPLNLDIHYGDSPR